MPALPRSWKTPVIIAGLLLLAPHGETQQNPVVEALPEISRDEMIATAKRLADHTWTCRKQNLTAACVRNYQSDWKENQVVKGVPYDWGGFDMPELLDKKLAQGQAAGSHSRHGITGCTAGIDCSGFVARCWGGKSRKYSTRNIREIAGRPRLNWFTDLKPGDAMNKPGSHIVLFAGYNPDGTPNVYEASGSAGKVVFRKWPWARFRGYYPLRYHKVEGE
jgi:hypothetical protein